MYTPVEWILIAASNTFLLHSVRKTAAAWRCPKMTATVVTLEPVTQGPKGKYPVSESKSWVRKCNLNSFPVILKVDGHLYLIEHGVGVTIVFSWVDPICVWYS